MIKSRVYNSTLPFYAKNLQFQWINMHLYILFIYTYYKLGASKKKKKKKKKREREKDIMKWEQVIFEYIPLN